jgi:ligand-binding SRPBCC domain-containing protein
MELHQISTKETGEKAISGKTTGLIGPGEQVTWRAKHFGIWQNLTSRITEFTFPSYFCDEMVKGAFAYFRHEHHFFPENNRTKMVDIFVFESPAGLFGRLFNRLVLTDYMKRLLEKRNQTIQAYAESDEWRHILQ